MSNDRQQRRDDTLRLGLADIVEIDAAVIMEWSQMMAAQPSLATAYL